MTERIALEDKMRLREEYERLRSYSLMPAMALGSPLGLDLWGKKGFLSWMEAMISRDCQAQHAHHLPPPSGNPNVTAELSMFIVNILKEWRDAVGRINNNKS